MNPSLSAEFWSLTFAPLVIAVLAALAAALLGNFLVLRRQALLGDAVSHVVLPGIVGAFLVTGTISSLGSSIGALLAALASVGLIEALRRRLRLDPGAAIGIVFTTMFALGVVLLEVSGASRVHLDVEHALYGNLESLVWLAATSAASLVDPAALAELPPAIGRLLSILALEGLLLFLLWRPLVMSSFDPVYAQARGLPIRLIGFGLAGLVALAAVAAFEAVGSVLVIAMFICPPAAARLLTDDLARQIRLSLALAAGSAAAGVLLAGYGPGLVGLNFGLSAAGSIATVSGLVLAWVALRSLNIRAS